MHFADNLCEDKKRQQFLLIGGFLGAGKTTLIGLITNYLESQERKVGLITNDQGQGLIDTASARNSSNSTGNVEEITGGCFCCRLDDLVDAIARLDKESRPEILIAEPVGSCTDLMATVLQPLEKIYHTPMSLAPLSVVLDARRALAALGGKKSRRNFHRDVGYVFKKQLEESEWLVVNKTDLLIEKDLEELGEKLSTKYPEKNIFWISAKTGEGVNEWIDALLSSTSQPEKMMAVDYERYAAGEAMLGWVNLEGLAFVKNCKPGDWLQSIGRKIADLLDQNGHEVGHFKMSLTSAGKRWRIHQVMGGEALELITDDHTHEEDAHFLVNLRAEGDASLLQGIVHTALHEQQDARVTLNQEAAFQPGKPEPTHRIS